ncbi:MAG: serine/threonine-protein kinase [Planctomycetota bacterium]|nr:serine/threonine-protein kinase [Planctomycetota bacterium]
MSAENGGQHPSPLTTSGGFGKSTHSLPETISVPPQDLTADPLLRPLPRIAIGDRSMPVLGRIPLLARLGKGAMGAVYYGVHPRLKNEVAVKVLQSFLAEKDPALIERFFREAQTAARVSSQHLVRVSDVDEEFGLFYIVMEYVRGLSVAEYIKQAAAAGRVGVDEQDALRIVIAASKGLAAAHTEGIIHRDVKPANIMLPRRKDGEECDLDYAKLADLGLARPEGQPSGLTVLFESLGTPGYMAPVQAQDA